MPATAPIIWIEKGVAEITWTFVTGVTGVSNSIDAANLPDKTVQVFGVTGGTSNVVIEGSNATAPSGPYTTLADPQGNALTFNDVGIEQILENPRWIRARASEVTAGVTITVAMVCRGSLR